MAMNLMGFILLALSVDVFESRRQTASTEPTEIMKLSSMLRAVVSRIEIASRNERFRRLPAIFFWPKNPIY